jgi:acyl transferase domain-containing protein/NAD(P)-dependent dehydrogenase (short-subunit alcohol dehydrogenase family)
MTASAATPYEPLAIVGLSCLFPQANSAEEFWSNVRRGVDAITEIPATHWRPEDYFNADPKSPDMTYAQRGGFLSPVAFDPLEFGIAPSNLEAIDTSQLLGLVGAKRALDDAGYGTGGKQFDRNRVGCILGVTGTLEMVIPLGARLGHPKWKEALKDAGVADDVANDVMQRIGESYVPWQENSFPGLLGNVVAGRIANRLDLWGTNCVVDAACASSLSAIHLAALELWSGRSDMVLTGGVDTFNDIFMFMCFSKTPALSATGDARPFADNADGTILGEGVGMLVLKRLADAQRDGDRIYALLRGIGTSSDGAGNAVYAPKKEGQVRCLQDAYRVAGVSPATIELVEAHGTGTKVGDATEIAGLTEVYRASGRTGTWCALGSIKSQIGHTKAAAGAAGVLKAVLALRHRVLPPTIKVNQPQDGLLDVDSPFAISTQARPWLASGDHPRRAAVSAFGFGGSNFHCVLEESPQRETTPDWDGEVVIAAFSADSAADLKRQLATWKMTADWATVRTRAAATRATFAASHSERLVFVLERGKSDVAAMVTTAESLLDKYAERETWSTPDGIHFGRGPRDGKLAVLFPGQGSQSVGMLRELACRFPAMQDVLAEANAAFADMAVSSSCVTAVSAVRNGDAATSARTADTAVAPTLAARLSELIYPPTAFSPATREQQEAALRATEVAQPALGAVSLGALAVLEQFGVQAELTAGHSYGELTALCASRRFQPQALYRLSMLRGRLMAEAQAVDGGMLAVGAPLSVVEEAIAESAVDLVVANRNGPNQVVLSGRLPDIDRAVDLFAKRNLRGKKLAVSAAFHSPLVAAASQSFRPWLDDVEFAAGDVPVYANSSADEYPDDADAARDLLAGQLAKPVDFVQQIENMYAAGARCFVEVGPGNVLTGLVGSILSGRDHRALAIDASAGKRAGLFDLAQTLAQLAAAGSPVTLSAWDPVPPPTESGDGQRLTIPICGANYVKPRAPRPPTPPKVAPNSPPPSPPRMVAPASMKSEPTNGSMSRPAPAPMPSSGWWGAPTAESGGVANRASDMVGTAHPTNSPAVSDALSVLQKMHAETARLHRQFLDGQTAAMRTLETLVQGRPANPNPIVAMSAAVTVPAPMIAPSAPPPPRPTPMVRESAIETAPERSAKPQALVESRSANDSLMPAVLAVVAEKTGYPVEMLKPAMSLDHDLGIDSIKRVEILSALQEKLPELPAVTPEQLQTLHRLQDVINILEASSPAKSAKPQAMVADRSANESLTPTVLAVVAEKTGYPVEMLKPAMSLDHDLGIDSIKRVEILSALQEKLPQLPAVTPEQLQTLHRLQDVIAILEASEPGKSAKPQATAGSSSADSLTPTVLAVVAEKTGYPVEMLKPAMSLDHDLGIDSIKRVEILSALQEKLPELPAVTPEQLQTLHRLQDVIDILEAQSPGKSARPQAFAEDRSTAEELNATVEPEALQCGTVVAAVIGENTAELLPYPAGGEFLIAEDGSELTAAVVARLTAAGYRPRVMAWSDAATSISDVPLAGVVLLASRAGVSDGQLWHAIEWAQHAGPRLRQMAATGHAAAFVTVARLDGEFGLGESAALGDVVSGGLAGLTKTVRHEWPEVLGKALDVASEWSDVDAMADAIIAEVLHHGPVECGLSPSGRTAVQVVPSRSTEPGKPLWSAGELVIVTGGARGVTAAAALAVAKATWPRFVLLGRSPAPEPEPDWLHGVREEPQIKQALATYGQASSPRALQEQCQRILANREIDATLSALRALGIEVEYRAVDVRDAAAVRDLFEELRRNHGPVRGLIHGAGVLADHKIADKTREEFDRVFGTKIEGLRNVLGAIDGDELRGLVLFSSFTARYGRTGQVDYAIANEVLNKLGQAWRRKHPACRVAAFNWGPWDGGMVRGGLKTLFANEGVGLIPLAAGANLVARAVREPATAPTEIVVLGPGSKSFVDEQPLTTVTQTTEPPTDVDPASYRVAFERMLSVERAPYLASHVLGGKAVLPVAMIVEWLGHAAMHRNPGLEFRGVDALKVYQGVKLGPQDALTLQVLLGKPQRVEGQFKIPAQLVSRQEGRQILHAAAEVWLGAGMSLTAAEPVARPKPISEWTAGEPYQLLFHGPSFQGITGIEHSDAKALVLQSRTATAPSEWTVDPFRPAWLADPLALDAALQGLILWCRTERHKPCLPTGWTKYRQFQRTFPGEAVTVYIRPTSVTEHRVTADVEFRDRTGQLVARLDGCDNVLDDALLPAFAANKLV